MTAALAIVARALAWIGGLGPRGWIALGGGAALAAGGLWISALRADNRDLAAAAYRLEAALAASEATSAARARAIDALTALAEADAARGRALDTSIREAEDADESDNGAVAPVLERALERVRQRAAAARD